jgi:hypothetical protein
MGSKLIVALTAGIMIDEKRNVLSQEWTTTYQSQLRYQIWKVLIKWLTKYTFHTFESKKTPSESSFNG